MRGFVEPPRWGNWACTDNWACMRMYASVLSDDFATMIAISELNPDVIGEDGFHAAAANCTLRSAVIEVPWFEGAQRPLAQFDAALAPSWYHVWSFVCVHRRRLVFYVCNTNAHPMCAFRRSNSIWDGLRTRLGR